MSFKHLYIIVSTPIIIWQFDLGDMSHTIFFLSRNTHAQLIMTNPSNSKD